MARLRSGGDTRPLVATVLAVTARGLATEGDAVGARALFAKALSEASAAAA